MRNLVEVRDLVKTFTVRGGILLKTIGTINAVNKVSFNVRRGEILGVVGESGCGKSTLARVILRLTAPTSGVVRYDGQDFLTVAPKELRVQRRKMQMVFQDPYSALDPRYTIFRSLCEPFKIQGIDLDTESLNQKIHSLIKQVGLNSEHSRAYPHELSGGQRQRAGIARALALAPEFLVLDEPTAALDVSVQAQIIKLLEKLRQEFALTYLFISHDLALVSYFCDRIIVMYLGHIVEILPSDSISSHARHPYTRALADSIFAPDPSKNSEIKPLEGEVPTPFKLPEGCVFASRCPNIQPICRQQQPQLEQVAPGESVACHFAFE